MYSEAVFSFFHLNFLFKSSAVPPLSAKRVAAERLKQCEVYESGFGKFKMRAIFFPESSNFRMPNFDQKKTPNGRKKLRFCTQVLVCEVFILVALDPK